MRNFSFNLPIAKDLFLEKKSHIFHFFFSIFKHRAVKKTFFFSHFAVGSQATISTADLSLPPCFHVRLRTSFNRKEMMRKKKCYASVRRRNSRIVQNGKSRLKLLVSISVLSFFCCCCHNM